MLRRGGIFLAAIALAVSVVATTPARSTAPAARNVGKVALSSYELGVLAQVNQFRREHGLVPLRISSSLTTAAREHSRSMVQRGYFSHDSADGSAFWIRIRRYYHAGRRGYWSVGENLLWSSPDVAANAALQMWADSPPHRENLLTPRWREIGIAAVHVATAPGTYGGREVTVITTDFGVRR
jgi:uncharacterized protein YkwD